MAWNSEAFFSFFVTMPTPICHQDIVPRRNVRILLVSRFEHLFSTADLSDDGAGGCRPGRPRHSASASVDRLPCSPAIGAGFRWLRYRRQPGARSGRELGPHFLAHAGRFASNPPVTNLLFRAGHWCMDKNMHVMRNARAGTGRMFRFSPADPAPATGAPSPRRRRRRISSSPRGCGSDRRPPDQGRLSRNLPMAPRLSNRYQRACPACLAVAP